MLLHWLTMNFAMNMAAVVYFESFSSKYCEYSIYSLMHQMCIPPWLKIVPNKCTMGSCFSKVCIKLQCPAVWGNPFKICDPIMGRFMSLVETNELRAQRGFERQTDILLVLVFANSTLVFLLSYQLSCCLSSSLTCVSSHFPFQSLSLPIYCLSTFLLQVYTPPTHTHTKTHTVIGPLQ